MPASSRDRVAHRRASPREQGLRSVVLWLPDVNDPAYRARLTAECRELARLTHDETVVADAFADLATQTDGWT